MFLAFTCDPWTEPADGFARAEPGEMSQAVFDRLIEQVEDEFEAGCPASCGEDCWSDDCVTSAGTHIVVEHARVDDGGRTTLTWDVSVERADQGTVTLASTWTRDWIDTGILDIDVAWTWEATWEGLADADLPAAGRAVVEVASSESISETGHSLWAREIWDDGTCAWDSTATHAAYDYYGTDDVDRWELHQGDQALIVGDEVETACWEVQREATLDGAPYTVRNADWSIVIDQDGDGASSTVDCDDHDATVSPCATEVADDGIDQDCDSADASEAVEDTGAIPPADSEPSREPEPSPERGCGHGAAALLFPFLRRRR